MFTTTLLPLHMTTPLSVLPVKTYSKSITERRTNVHLQEHMSCHTRGEHFFMLLSDLLLINARMLTQNQ